MIGHSMESDHYGPVWQLWLFNQPMTAMPLVHTIIKLMMLMSQGRPRRDCFLRPATRHRSASSVAISAPLGPFDRIIMVSPDDDDSDRIPGPEGAFMGFI